MYRAPLHRWKHLQPNAQSYQILLDYSIPSVGLPQSLSLLCRAGKHLPKRYPLSKLNPFVDKSDGILRVGGRLVHSSLPRESKHPAILPKNSVLSRLFMRHSHCLSLHGGPTLTQSVLQQCVWITGSISLVKAKVRQCIRCQCIRPRLAHQLMGDLPVARVNPARPFTVTGLDYAGPFKIRLRAEDTVLARDKSPYLYALTRKQFTLRWSAALKRKHSSRLFGALRVGEACLHAFVVTTGPPFKGPPGSLPKYLMPPLNFAPRSPLTWLIEASNGHSSRQILHITVGFGRVV